MPPPWPDARHRAFVIATMTVAVAGLYELERLFWPRTPLGHNDFSRAWAMASVVWLSAALPAVMELAGLLAHRFPRDLRSVQPIPQLVCWRIVSRGLNSEALTETILRCRY